MADIELNHEEGSSGLASMLITAAIFTLGYFYGKAVAHSECEELDKQREKDGYYEDDIRYNKHGPYYYTGNKRRKHNHTLTTSSTICLIL